MYTVIKSSKTSQKLVCLHIDIKPTYKQVQTTSLFIENLKKKS